MYELIQDFKAGLDTRRTALTSKNGTLQECNNAHITRGGEIEKRKAFVEFATLPASTFGLKATGTALYVFGSAAAPSMPSGVLYQRLQHPDGTTAMTKLRDAELFDGKIYAIAQFADGAVYHYYNGTRVTQWDAIAAVVSNNAGVAAALAAKIDLNPYLSATSTGATLTITGPVDDNFTIKVYAINGGSDTTQAISRTTTQASTSLLPKIVDVTISGTLEQNDLFVIQITLNIEGDDETFTFRAKGSTAGTGTTVTTFGGKIYSTADSVLFFSEINAPRRWSDNNGGGFIDIGTYDGGSDTLTNTAIYQGNLAVFARRSVQIWAMDPDPLQNRQGQVLTNIGTVAPHSVTSFGDLDVFFLADSGVRSLRARDASNNATVSDVGTAIDTLIAADFSVVSEAERAAACGVIEPTDGRYWLAMGEKIYVFSYFPTSQISAWSTYTAPTTFTFMTVLNGQVYARGSGDKVYLYGGEDGETYDDSEVTVTLPFINAGKPAHQKTLEGIDMTCDGAWTVYAGMDTSVPEARVEIGTYTGSTWDKARMAAPGLGTHVGIKLVNSAEGYARLSNFAAHFQINDPS